jgi:uncharacterized protein YciI
MFAVISLRGPTWNSSSPLEGQVDWDAHAAFMDGLHADGFVLLAGPLEGTQNVLVIVRADSAEEIRSRLSEDPWMRNDLLRISVVAPWTIRIGALG